MNKLTIKQFELLKKLYVERGKKLTPNVEEWLIHLPRYEAIKLIDKWIATARNKRIYGNKTKKTSRS